MTIKELKTILDTMPEEAEVTAIIPDGAVLYSTKISITLDKGMVYLEGE